MGANTKISWCDFTFNMWRGCRKVAAGCANCYADREAKRFPLNRGVWGPHGTRVIAAESMWREPVKWNRQAPYWVECEGCHWRRYLKPGLEETFCERCSHPCGNCVRPRVFCASLADVFEDWPNIMRGSNGGFMHHGAKWGSKDKYIEIADIAIGKSRVTMDDARRRLFELIDATPNLDWLLVTKRPENIRKMWPAVTINTQEQADDRNERGELYRRNVWLLTSVATQEDVDMNLPELCKCRRLVPVLGISAEPLLESIDITPYLFSSDGFSATDENGENVGAYHRLDGGVAIDWVIGGGESGPHARLMRRDAISSLRDQCNGDGPTGSEVPFHFKQWGEWCPAQECNATSSDRPINCEAHNNAAVARFYDDFSGLWYYRVGKQASGRMLSGREWNEFPQVNHG
jgi:protein gp37